MIELAIWIIAICEVIRLFYCQVQLSMMQRDNSKRENAYAEFIKSLKQDDKEFVRRMLEEYEKKENNDDIADEQDS